MNDKGVVVSLVRENLKQARLRGHRPEFEVGERFAPSEADQLGLYVIVRRFAHLQGSPVSFVDEHEHSVPSLWLVLGDRRDLTGLSIQARLGGELAQEIRAPAVVWIPQNVKHTYRPLAGSGLYVNVVLTREYNEVTTA